MCTTEELIVIGFIKSYETLVIIHNNYTHYLQQTANCYRNKR